MALKGIQMDFRMFLPTNVLTLGRMCWAAVAVALLATVSASGVQAQTYNIRPGDTLRIEVAYHLRWR